MQPPKVGAGAMPLDREKEWLFQFKGVKEGAQKALWAAMDMCNSLFASRDKWTLERQEYTWLTMHAYLNARKGFYLEGDDLSLGFDQTAELILNFDSTQSARMIVEGMRRMMEGDDKGAEDALRVAEHWFAASRDREQEPPKDPYRVPIQTQNRFLPLIGQPISGKCFFGPICPAATNSYLATDVVNKLLARDTWEIGECECECSVSGNTCRIIAFPNAGHIGIDGENRVGIDYVDIGDGGTQGRRSYCVSPMPRWVAEGLAAGWSVGGTCVNCGNVVTVGTDPVEGGLAGTYGDRGWCGSKTGKWLPEG